MKPDALQWLLEHSASAYEDELHSAERLQDRIGFVVSIMITPLSWAFVYLLINFKGSPVFSIPNIVFFWSPLGFAGFMLLASIALVAYALLRGFRYAGIPPPWEILSYFQNHPRSLSDLGVRREGKRGCDKNLRKFEANSELFNENLRRFWPISAFPQQDLLSPTGSLTGNSIK